MLPEYVRLTSLGGLPVHEFEELNGWARARHTRNASARGAARWPTMWDQVAADAPAPDAVAWRLETDFDGDIPFDELADAFLTRIDTSAVRAVVTGHWHDEYLRHTSGAEVVDILCAHADRFPALRHLYINAIGADTADMSSIPPTDITAVLDSFPDLEELRYRFGRERRPRRFVLRPVRHRALRRLVLETTGLPAHVPRALAESDLPALTDLELWFGTRFGGGDAGPDDVRGLLDGAGAPALRRLALRNAEQADEIAETVARTRVAAHVRELDLSLGTLSDAGADALLAGRPFTRLQRLTIHHHFVGAEALGRLRTGLAVVETDVSPPARAYRSYEDADGRYVPDELGRHVMFGE